MKETIISIIILSIISLALIFLFSDEFLDRQEQKMIEKELKERLNKEGENYEL